MSDKNTARFLHITIPVLIAVISVFIVTNLTLKPECSSKIIASIDESKDDVLKLTAASTAVSVAITSLPGDMATPVASTLADLSKGFMLVLCALYLEKFLVSVTGIVAFQWLVPFACLIYIVGFLAKRNQIRQLALKIACFALMLFLVIPTGAGISGLIQEKYGMTIDQIVESAKSSANLIEDSVENYGDDENAGNGLGKILKNLQQSGDEIARGTSQFMKYLEKLVNQFVEAVAVMLVASCIIPVLVLLCFVWLSKLIFSAGAEEKMEITNLNSIKKLLKRGENDEEENNEKENN